VLECADLPEPTQVHGVTQHPMEGVSMRYSFDAASAAERHETQYFEMFCNRGIYHKGWSAVTKHRTPWEVTGHAGPFDEDVWELYDGSKDWTQAHDLAKEQPAKLKELQQLFLIEAARHNVLPLDDRFAERLNPDMAGRPTLIQGDTQLLFDGMQGLQESCMLNLKNKSYSVTAEVTVPDGGARGVIVNEGGRGGGWVLYVDESGAPVFHVNFCGFEQYPVPSRAALEPGRRQLRVEFAYDGGGIGKGGDVTLYVDGNEAGTGRVERTHAYGWSLCETGGVGQDTGSPVCDGYPAVDNRFTGTIEWVRLDIATDTHDHLLDPDQHLRLAMTKQ
jgi:arylsulfatase